MKVATAEMDESLTEDGKSKAAVEPWTKIHQTLRTTPAMAAGLTERMWDMADVVAMIEGGEAPVQALTVSAEHSE